ncbi:uncharacterized protein [Haliotis asinina]|uniref:uncharacterized protein n=1 Tax=Haliotis asinina TaxID=109174 RepID=UPI0035321FD6
MEELNRFDTIDHAMLLSRLEHDYGLNGTVLEWCSSCLTDRKQLVQINKAMSRSEVLACGIPQGSVLGPILFTMYTRPLGHLISEKHVAHHFYADDSQLVDSFRPTLATETTATLARSLILSRLDYYNSLLVGISGDQLNRLQKIQNRAARIITRTKLHSHISPALKSLHWLRIRERIDI